MKRLVAVAALTTAALLGAANPAVAHNQLVSSDPEDGAHRDTGPRQVRLTFDEPVRPGYDAVSVIGPNGQQWADGPARVEDNNVTAPVRELGPAGTYTVGFRVLSNDGHPVTDKVTFTLTSPGRGTPAPPPGGAEDQSSQEQDQPAGGMPVWPWVAGAIVVVGVGLALALRLGRPSDKK